MSPPEHDNIASLRDRWTHLYASHLPALAKARDPAQKHWPVHLDHCFARIILDNAVGVDKPWTKAVKSPAVRNMTVEQLRDALALGERVARGEVDLVELDGVSLRLRGKKEKGVGGSGMKGEEKGKGAGGNSKRKAADETISKYFAPTPDESPSKSKRVKTDETTTPESKDDGSSDSKDSASHNTTIDNDMAAQIKRIASSTTLTPFRKQTLTLLCRIPPGRWSTYQAMSDYISATSHKTCARAVGSAMRNNPFAPEVPCHRILSSDGSIGGFKGDWGAEGKYAGEKKRLLGEEGVKFDSGGKVKGQAFRDFGG
jgi:methylated-DNA-[protein]-cysteine S-methyltransferase